MLPEENIRKVDNIKMKTFPIPILLLTNKDGVRYLL